jgi:penicillin-binding protein 1A
VVPQVIAKVTTADGTVLPMATPAPKQILTKAQNDILNYVLQQVVQKGTGVNANFPTPIAGKTGTTNDSTDAWFIGYTPRLTAAVWMGYRDGSKPMLNLGGTSGGAQGGGIPAGLWRHFMAAVTANGANGAYTGSFAPVATFPGPLIATPSSLISFPKGTGTATTTTVPKSTSTPVAPGPGTTTPVNRPATTVPHSPTTTVAVTSTSRPGKTTTVPPPKP